MAIFKKISVGKTTFETLRNYFSVNAQNTLSFLYRYVMSCLYPLQVSWYNYENYRNYALILANTKWQISNLTNVLNYLFDPTNSITITQASYLNVYAPDFDQKSSVYAYEFDDTLTTGQTQLFCEEFDDNILVNGVVINTPSSDISKNVKTFADQVVITGLSYTLNPLP